MTQAWPLVGRESERAEIEALLEDANARGVVIAGPAGVGKTHLARAIVAQEGASVVNVRATRAAGRVPLGAFAPFLPADLGGGDDGTRLRRAAAALESSFESDARPIVCIDDAHLLDPSSAALVFQLALDGKVFLLVVLRSDDDATGMLLELWKDELPRIDLRAFPEERTAEALEAALGGAVERATVHSLHEASGGNVLYLREFVAGLLDAKSLVQQGGLWRLVGPITSTPRLNELMTSRLRDLDETERLVLEVVALGEPCGAQQLEARGWADAQEALERRGLIVGERSGNRWRVRLAHPLYGEVARDQLTETRRRAIARGLAEAVADRGMRRRDDARRVALWLLDGGMTADPDVLLTAARDALFGADLATVARLARAALDAGAGAPAAHILGRALDGVGDNEQAESVLAAAEALADDPADRALLALARADNLFRGLGRAAESEAVLVAAERAVSDPVLRARIASQRAVQASFEGRTLDALALTMPLLESAEGVAFCEAALPASGAMRMLGRLDEAIALSERGLAARQALGPDVQAPATAVYLVSRSQSLLEYGRLEDAGRISRRGYDFCVRANFRDGIAWFAFAHGMVELYTGRLERAMRLARESAVVFGERAHAGARWAFVLLALAAAQRGDVLVAEAALADFDVEPPTPIRVSDCEADRARGWTAVARGEWVEGRALMRSAAARARADGLVLFEAHALFDHIRTGSFDPVADRFLELATLIDGPLMAAQAQALRAALDHDPAGLDAAADSAERCGAVLLAGECAATAAREHRVIGNARAASASSARSAAWIAQCEGARTPPLTTGEQNVVLSKREREVASLAADGLTNKAIAEALFVSTRTVENHLQRAYEKLGIRSRDELGDALERVAS
ncbi:MAG: LuxR C-terminal-related transcriptional regulator [Acidimicrobiia bacterium]